MALSSRDMWVILRARDEASRVLRSFGGNMRSLDRDAAAAAQRMTARGQAMVTIGAAIMSSGLIAIGVLNDMTKAAAEYQQQAAYALTQTDGVATSLGELKSIGREVARVIPAPFQQMQGALYDIFSSIDVTVDEAELLLREFSRAAVAGQVDLQYAARGTIAILNAYKLPVRDVNRVNDIMFQLVRKGVGTYEEFSRAIGRAIPASVRAGQEFEILGGMMAFLTRNGLSVQMAATSSARALEALVNPRTVSRLEGMGISVRDTAGEFRPLPEILAQMNEQFSTMTSPERAAAMQNLFRTSGGTIQARRFFDVVFTNFDEFLQRVADMEASAGALDEAYDIMFEQPQTQIQLMTNKYEIMRTEIGDKLLPIKMQLVDALSALLDKWNSLSPAMQNVIVYGAAIASGLAVVAGGIVALSGASLILTARFGGLGAAMTRVQTRSAGLGLALGKGRAAGLLAVVFAVISGVEALKARMDTDLTVGMEEGQRAIREFSINGGAQLDVFFNKIHNQVSASSEGMLDLDSAIDQVFNRSWEAIHVDWWRGLVGMETSFSKAKEAFGELDMALAQMIQSGNPDAAERAFERIAEKAKAQGVSMEELVDLFPEYADALSGIQYEQEVATEMAERYAHILGGVMPDSLEEVNQAIQEHLDMVAKADASFIDFLGTYDQLMKKNEDLAKAVAESTEDQDDSWEDYIDQFGFKLDEYISMLEESVRAQQEWETNMIILSGRASQGLLDHLTEMGSDGAEIVAALVNATDDELARMEAVFYQRSTEATQEFANVLSDPRTIAVMEYAAANLGEGTAKEIADKLSSGTATIEQIMADYAIIVEGTKPEFNVESQYFNERVEDAKKRLIEIAMMKPTPELQAEASQLWAIVNAAQAHINSLKGKTVRLTAEYIAKGAWPTGVPRPVAKGGYITGPGTATSDSIPALLSNGEYVIKAAAVARYGVHMMDQLNAMRLRDGGPVGTAPVVQRVASGAVVEPRSDNRPPVQVIFEPGAVITQEIDPVVHAEQLGYRIAMRVVGS